MVAQGRGTQNWLALGDATCHNCPKEDELAGGKLERVERRQHGVAERVELDERAHYVGVGGTAVGIYEQHLACLVGCEEGVELSVEAIRRRRAVNERQIVSVVLGEGGFCIQQLSAVHCNDFAHEDSEGTFARIAHEEGWR